MTPNDIQVVIPGIFYHVTLYSKKKKKEGGLCGCDRVKDLEMGRLF